MARLKTNGNEIVKPGMRVMWRGCFGFDAPQEAGIESIELCEDEHEKYGEPVDEVDAKDLYRCCICLDNEHWCYGYQITEILG